MKEPAIYCRGKRPSPADTTLFKSSTKTRW